jgi:hypothetical protein
LIYEKGVCLHNNFSTHHHFHKPGVFCIYDKTGSFQDHWQKEVEKKDLTIASTVVRLRKYAFCSLGALF